MAKREIKQLFGNRVALEMVEEEYQGLLVPAPTAAKLHVISRVVALGDGVKQDIKVGDILFWQTNAMIQKHCRYDLNGQALFILMTGDMVARLKSRVMDRSNFQILGDYFLCRRDVIQPKKIILPDEVIEANQETTVKFIVDDMGDTALLDEKGVPTGKNIKLGDEVIVDRTKANPIQLGEESKVESDEPKAPTYFYYIHKNFVLGTVG